MYADELLLPWFGGLAERLPGMRLADARTHLGGNDPDGSAARTPASSARSRWPAGGRWFPLMERAGYQAANDAVLAAASASPSRCSRTSRRAGSR